MKKLQKGFANIVLIIIIVVLIVLIGYLVLVKKSNEPIIDEATSLPENTTSNTNTTTTTTLSEQDLNEAKIIANLKANWQEIEIASLPAYKDKIIATFKNNVFLIPKSVQFIGNNNFLIQIQFQNIEIEPIAVFNFNNNEVNLVKFFPKQTAEGFLIAGPGSSPNASDWQNLVNEFGDPAYPISTYTTEVVRGVIPNIKSISFKELTKVPENVFISNYWQ